MLVYAAVGSVLGVALLAAIGASVYCKLSRRTSKKADVFIPTETFEAYENPIWKKSDAERAEPLERLAALKTYSFIDLQSATDDFSPSCLISGAVYRGRINGDLAAIKRMKSDVSKEITLLAKISHFNLVRVLGACFNDGQCYVIYEYASKGPLSDSIFHNNGDGIFLTWTRRIQIVLDVARGLNYIHSYFSPPRVHMGIKSSNILLDNEFRGKISNFGLARSGSGEKGCVCPEFLRSGEVSTKMDVYAFGVVMAEILTGKEVTTAEDLTAVIGESRLKSSMDSALSGNYPADQVSLMGGLVESCLKREPSVRPAMEEVVRSLSKVLTASLAWESSGT